MFLFDSKVIQLVILDIVKFINKVTNTKCLFKTLK